MKTVPLCAFAALILMTPALDAQQEEGKGKYHAWWNDPNIGAPLKSPNARALPLLRVAGNAFVDSTGKALLMRGVAISDPDKIENQGRWSRDHFVRVRDLGAKVVRIPVHPIAWRERTPARYLQLLDQAVNWCAELGMYVIIDWHSIGNLQMELFQDPMYITTKQETYEFWRTMARHYKGHTTPIFFELFNEPTLYNGELGRMSWSEWKQINENIITVIRAYDPEKIPLVAGLDWGYDLTPLLIEPIAAQGIGYVTHPYPHKRSKPYEPKWEENFGFAAGRVPVFATELSFTLGDEGMAANGEYGRSIIRYLEGKGIGWVAWVFDPEWSPRMIRSWDSYELTECGDFFKKALHGDVRP